MPDGDRELVVVVGASGAFGSAIVARVVGSGRDVLAVGRNADSIAPLTERYGAAVHPCVADITDDASIDTIRAALDGVATGGCAVRAVVHGPGLARGGDIAEVPTSVVLDAVDTKVAGLLRLVRAVDERFVTGARIIAIAGHYGLEPTSYAAPAGIANAALFNVVRQLSLVYGHRGITAHTIAPGPADTDRLRRIAADRAASQGTAADSLLEDLRAESSIGALTTPDQVAWAVTMLLAPEADAMTGSTLMLDAGRRRGLP